MKKASLFVVLLGVSFLFGCTTRMTDYTLISTKNVDLSKMNTYQRAGSRVKGQDVTHTILIFPSGMPNMKEAIDNTIEATPGCVALTDGVVFSRSFYIPLIYGQSAYVIEGTPLIDPEF